MSAASSIRLAGRQAWLARSPREQQLLSLAGALILLALLWRLVLGPAWQTWQEAPDRQTRLDAQTLQMRALQGEAQSLKKPSAVQRSEALRWLESNLDTLGPGARIQRQGDQASLTVQAAPAEHMARWLSQAREQAQALPVQAQLQRLPVPGKASASPSASPHPQAAVAWRGTVLLRLPDKP